MVQYNLFTQTHHIFTCHFYIFLTYIYALINSCSYFSDYYFILLLLFVRGCLHISICIKGTGIRANFRKRWRKCSRFWFTTICFKLTIDSGCAKFDIDPIPSKYRASLLMLKILLIQYQYQCWYQYYICINLPIIDKWLNFDWLHCACRFSSSSSSSLCWDRTGL